MCCASKLNLGGASNARMPCPPVIHGDRQLYKLLSFAFKKVFKILQVQADLPFPWGPTATTAQDRNLAVNLLSLLSGCRHIWPRRAR